MKDKWTIVGSILAMLLLALAASLTLAQEPQPPGESVQLQGDMGIQAAMGTAFTYQGQLRRDGNLVNGACDFRFTLWDAETGGNQIGPIQDKTNVSVTNGLFTVQLDFGAGAFRGDARWLQIAVRCTGDVGYVTLTPRQPLTPAPYAVYALNAGPAIPVLFDDFDRSTLNLGLGWLASPQWITSTSGLGSVHMDPDRGLVIVDSGYGGAGAATLYGKKQRSVLDGTLIFKANLLAYEDNNVAYGDGSPRGLVNGTNRNNAIEFINHTGSAVKARTVKDGMATETIYFIPGTYPENSVDAVRFYMIVATPTEVKFYLDGVLIATHTTNIPTASLNPYFDVSYGGYGTISLGIDYVSYEIIR